MGRFINSRAVFISVGGKFSYGSCNHFLESVIQLSVYTAVIIIYDTQATTTAGVLSPYAYLHTNASPHL